MPYLNPSYASRGIVVEAADVDTTLTISAPASVAVGQSFAVTGILIRNDTGGPVVGANIELKYNNTALGNSTTGVDGDYLRSVSISTEGSCTLKASFGGMNVGGLSLAPSLASKLTRVLKAAEGNPLLILIGIALAIFLTGKK